MLHLLQKMAVGIGIAVIVEIAAVVEVEIAVDAAAVDVTAAETEVAGTSVAAVTETAVVTVGLTIGTVRNGRGLNRWTDPRGLITRRPLRPWIGRVGWPSRGRLRRDSVRSSRELE